MKRNDLSQIQFDIKFYEKLIKSQPDHIDALTALGDAYTKIGEYKKGLIIDKKLVALRNDDETVFYNLACSYALLKMTDESIMALTRSIELGYSDVMHLQKDRDLDNIRTDERFQELITQLKQKHNKSPLT